MDNPKGLIVIISGPSGCGKGTVIKELMKHSENLWFSVSATTRQPRPGEENGIDYLFVQKEEFQNLIKTRGVLEYTQYNGNYYGTPKQPIEEAIESGKDAILDIEIDGADQIKQKMPQAISVFLMPPSFDVLEKRLRGRGTETKEAIENRLKRAREEMEHVVDYDYMVINETVLDAATQIMNLIQQEKKKRSKE